MDESQKHLINKLFNVSYFLAPQHLILGYHLIVDGDDNNHFGSDRLSNKSKLYKDKINSRKVGRNSRLAAGIYRIGASGIPICRERTAPDIDAAQSLSLRKRGPYGITKALGSLPSGAILLDEKHYYTIHMPLAQSVKSKGVKAKIE
jgi:hypothetical protein